MGQYFLIVNKTKREYIDPLAFGSGRKIREFADYKAAQVLVYLLADNADSVYPESDIISRWAGDEIVVAGGYGPGFISGSDKSYTLYDKALSEFTNISAMCKLEES